MHQHSFIVGLSQFYFRRTKTFDARESEKAKNTIKVRCQCVDSIGRKILIQKQNCIRFPIHSIFK